MQLEQKTVIVSGGASGLGAATVDGLLSAGAKVAILDLNPGNTEQLIEQAGHDNAVFIKTDVTSDESADTAIKTVFEKFGTIHALINCAGVAPAKKVLDREGKAMPLDDFKLAININLIGSFNLARLAAEQMAKNTPDNADGERGVIINVASVAAYEGQMGQASYAASKGGIVSMTLPMARELAKLGIRVNAIAPGIMGTPMLLAMPDNVQESLVAGIQYPKRMGYPNEFAGLAKHIIENNYINGETIRLDGAIRMQPR